MEKDFLHFIVSSSTLTDYLILEVYIEDQLIADLYNEKGVWEVDFMKKEGQWSLSWEICTQIHQKFADFVEEMKEYPVNSSEEG